MGEDPRLTCQSYTRARRHPLIIGKIQGHSLPVMLTPTQLGVLVVGVILAVNTRGLWGPLVGGGQAEAVVILAVPGLAAFAVRHLRMEGRSPVRMGLGLATYAGRRSTGTEMLGRPVRDRPPTRWGTARVYVSALSAGAGDTAVEVPVAVPDSPVRRSPPRRPHPPRRAGVTIGGTGAVGVAGADQVLTASPAATVLSAISSTRRGERS